MGLAHREEALKQGPPTIGGFVVGFSGFQRFLGRFTILFGTAFALGPFEQIGMLGGDSSSAWHGLCAS